MAGPALRFFFDYLSHNAYLAAEALPPLAARHGRTIEWVPVLFAGLLAAHGQLGPAEVPAKNRWMLRDVLRKARRLGVPLAPPASHPFAPLLALRATCAATDPSERARLVSALFRATWAESRDVSDPAVVSEVARAVGLDGAALVEAAAQPQAKAALRAETEAAIAEGVFGVPTVIVAGELFWGYDDFAHLALCLEGRDPLAGHDPSAWLQVRPSAQRKQAEPG